MHLDNKFDADLAFDFDHIIECVFGLVFSFFFTFKKIRTKQIDISYKNRLCVWVSVGLVSNLRTYARFSRPISASYSGQGAYRVGSVQFRWENFYFVSEWFVPNQTVQSCG